MADRFKPSRHGVLPASNVPRPLFGLLRLRGFFGPGRLFAAMRTAAFMRTVSAALGAITTRATMASVAMGFFALGFAGFVSGCFRTSAAFFGFLLVFFRLGRRRDFRRWKRSAAFDADFEFGDDVSVESEFDVVFAEDADGVFEMDLPLVEADIELGLELIGDHTRSNGAEHFAVLTGFDSDDANEFGETLGELGHGVELVGFAFGAALLENFKATFVRAGQRNCKALRKEKIAGVTSRDLDLVGLATEADDVVCQNDFSLHRKNA
jgi:hypothetical protein